VSEPRRLLDDPVLRQQMGAAGRRKVEQHYQWETLARKTEAVYRQVLGQS